MLNSALGDRAALRCWALLCGLFLLAACVKNDHRITLPRPDSKPEETATIVFQLVFPQESWDPTTANHVTLVAMGEDDGPRYFTTVHREAEFEVLHVPPGRYRFLCFATNVRRAPTQKALPRGAYDPRKHLPVRPFSVEVGDVIYAGNLKVSGLRRGETISGPDARLSYDLSTDAKSARAVLEALDPALAKDMETRLFVLEEQAPQP